MKGIIFSPGVSRLCNGGKEDRIRPDPATGCSYRRFMVHRILVILLVFLLCACVSSRKNLSQVEVPVITGPLPPEMKPLTVEQEEQVRASGAR